MIVSVVWATVRYPVEHINLKRLAIPSIVKDVEQRELSQVAGGNVKICKNFGIFFNSF